MSGPVQAWEALCHQAGREAQQSAPGNMSAGGGTQSEGMEKCFVSARGDLSQRGVLVLDSS